MALLFLVLFLAIPPGLLSGAKYLKDYMKAQLLGRRRSTTAIRAQNEKEGLNKKIKKRVKFTTKDTRKSPVPFRLIFFGIYSFGAAASILAGFMGNFSIFLFSIFVAYSAIIFSYVTANKIVSERDTVLKRMMELKGSKMRFVVRDKGVTPSVDSEFQVVEWAEDLVTPRKLYIFLPTDFDILQVDGFLESFNLIFGKNGQWISDDTDEQYGGFDFNSGVAAIKTSTPLPQRADWHERYLNSKDVHWSFFPLALGSENGVPVYNEDLGVTEHVLGFAVNGGQEKLSKKNGVVLGKEVTSSPQILIAGGTNWRREILKLRYTRSTC